MLRKLAAGAFILFATLIGLEGALRLVPSAIPLQLLQHFESGLRIEIAQRLGLANRARVRELTRDDGGPPLFINKPHATFASDGDLPTMDGAGFCNPSEAAAASHADLVAIGDSLTRCLDVPAIATWPYALRGLSGASVYNLGIPRIGPYEYLQLLKRFGLAKCPRVVVMAIYEGNDLRDAVAYEHHVAGHAPTSESTSGPMTLADMLGTGLVARHSYVFNLPFAAAAELFGIGPGSSAYRAVIAADENAVDFRYRLKFSPGTVRFNRPNTDTDEVVHAESLGRGDVDLSVFDGALSAYVALAARHGFVPAVVYIPSAHTAYAEFVRFDDARLEQLMPAYSSRLREYFAAAAVRFGYRFIDATPALQEAARRLRKSPLLYFPSNLHLTVDGHRIVAESILDFAAMAKARPAAPGACR